MKLLIDIPEHVYEHAKESSEDSNDEFDAMRAIANGTQQESRSEIPNTCGDAISRQAVLDKIRAEIADLDDADYDYEGYYKAVTDAVEIIDKYKAEGSEE